MQIAEAAKILAKYAPNELERLGLPTHKPSLSRVLKSSFLGKGVYGAAFDLEDGRVLKFTIDSADAFSCRAVMNVGGVRGVVKIYDVFRVRSTKDQEYYGIVQDKVISLSALKKYVSKPAAKKLIAMLDIIFNEVYGVLPKIGDDALDQIRFQAEQKRFTSIEIDTCVRWTEQLISTLIDLRHIKVFVHDLHAHNAGFVFNGGDLDLVLFDLGNRSYRGGQMELRLASNP